MAMGPPLQLVLIGNPHGTSGLKNCALQSKHSKSTQQALQARAFTDEKGHPLRSFDPRPVTLPVQARHGASQFQYVPIFSFFESYSTSWQNGQAPATNAAVTAAPLSFQGHMMIMSRGVEGLFDILFASIQGSCGRSAPSVEKHFAIQAFRLGVLSVTRGHEFSKVENPLLGVYRKTHRLAIIVQPGTCDDGIAVGLSVSLYHTTDLPAVDLLQQHWWMLAPERQCDRVRKRICRQRAKALHRTC